MTIRFGFLGAAALAFAAFFAVTPASAQPAGSYQSSCNNISANGGVLRARCQTEEGEWLDSRLDDYGACAGDISNDDGRLTCERDDEDRGDRDRGDRGDQDRGGERLMPPGSYQESCRNERIDDDDLVADCTDRNGRVHHAELQNYRRCHGDIANDDGALRCVRHEEGGDYDFAVPTGSWRACR